jgi:hypothetical protein
VAYAPHVKEEAMRKFLFFKYTGVAKFSVIRVPLVGCTSGTSALSGYYDPAGQHGRNPYSDNAPTAIYLITIELTAGQLMEFTATSTIIPEATNHWHRILTSGELAAATGLNTSYWDQLSFAAPIIEISSQGYRTFIPKYKNAINPGYIPVNISYTVSKEGLAVPHIHTHWKPGDEGRAINSDPWSLTPSTGFTTNNKYASGYQVSGVLTIENTEYSGNATIIGAPEWLYPATQNELFWGYVNNSNISYDWLWANYPDEMKNQAQTVYYVRESVKTNANLSTLGTKMDTVNSHLTSLNSTSSSMLTAQQGMNISQESIANSTSAIRISQEILSVQAAQQTTQLSGIGSSMSVVVSAVSGMDVDFDSLKASVASLTTSLANLAPNMTHVEGILTMVKSGKTREEISVTYPYESLLYADQIREWLELSPQQADTLLKSLLTTAKSEDKLTALLDSNPRLLTMLSADPLRLDRYYKTGLYPS